MKEKNSPLDVELLRYLSSLGEVEFEKIIWMRVMMLYILNDALDIFKNPKKYNIEDLNSNDKYNLLRARLGEIVDNAGLCLSNNFEVDIEMSKRLENAYLPESLVKAVIKFKEMYG